MVDFPNSPCFPGAQVKLKTGNVFGAISSLSLHPQIRTWRLLGEEFFFFFFGCVGSSLLQVGFFQVWQVGATL